MTLEKRSARSLETEELWPQVEPSMDRALLLLHDRADQSRDTAGVPKSADIEVRQGFFGLMHER
jgi:hypothetical protein